MDRKAPNFELAAALQRITELENQLKEAQLKLTHLEEDYKKIKEGK